jgi:hypothetical protein
MSLVIGINDGCEQLEEIRDRGWLSEYFIEGLLGQETYKHEIRGKVIRKAEYGEFRLAFSLPHSLPQSFPTFRACHATQGLQTAVEDTGELQALHVRPRQLYGDWHMCPQESV